VDVVVVVVVTGSVVVVTGGTVVVVGGKVVVVVGGSVSGLVDVAIPHTPYTDEFQFAHVNWVVLVSNTARGPFGSKPSTTTKSVL
jgi:hypothetical protein